MPQKTTTKELKQNIKEIEDALERRELQKQLQLLQESENRFRNLAEFTAAGIAIIQGNRFVYVNPAWKKIAGYSSREILKMNFQDLAHPDGYEEIHRCLSNWMRGKDVNARHELKIMTKKGETRWLDLSVTPFEQKGEPAILGSAFDITSRKIAENEKKKTETDLAKQVKERTAELAEANLALRDEMNRREQTKNALSESEEHLRSLMESATNFAIFRLLHDEKVPLGLRVIFVSPSIADIIGVSDPMNFKTWFKNIHPDDEKRVMEASRRAFEARHFSMTMRVYHPQKKKWCWVQAISSGIRTEKDGPLYFNGILMDITERKVIVDKLEIMTNNLNDINCALKVMLAKVDEEKRLIVEQMLDNVRIRIFPHLDECKKGRINPRLKHHLDMIETTLNDIVSPLANVLSSKYLNLTPTEIRIAHLIKDGRTTKEISNFLNVSTFTIDTHRGKIRKKLRINNKKENLRTRLLTFE